MNNRYHGRQQGLRLVEITPIVVGGDPTDPKNKTWVTQKQHFEIVRYWNRVISKRRRQDADREG